MFLRIAAIALILIFTSIAWVILGATIDHRTNSSDDKLRPGVASIWGSPQEQAPPSASYIEIVPQKVETVVDGHKTTKIEERRESVALPIESSRIRVGLALDHRQRGLLWYSTYVVDFAGIYTFRNATASPRWITYMMRFPAEHAIYDGLVMELNGQEQPLRSDKQFA